MSRRNKNAALKKKGFNVRDTEKFNTTAKCVSPLPFHSLVLLSVVVPPLYKPTNPFSLRLSFGSPWSTLIAAPDC
jgi:hypothetical protein